MKAPTPALFLDRDGVINVDVGYAHTREQFTFVDGIKPLICRANNMGYKVVVVTNQSGIARGYYTEDDFLALTQWMLREIANAGGQVHGVYYCPHLPDAKIKRYREMCDCRKPRPGMLLQAQQALNINMARSIMIGDKPSDIAAAEHAGVGTKIFFSSNKNSSATCAAADRVVSDLNGVLR